ncbi:hypothetical protein BGZ61DRAFT_539338 [Ilyonectria robusta]|uniref:uncharacterized protein n=1 Tax=Ilyonectria robusta TaxID=1079257 RepID=UPI001E8E35E8|nr:uncharacterized protein BGZ61DRAFT_539338 [Ilyonectria robusta]KAH8663311.1 hypothetical protein BGZ61DRAFT_539338 [Ilyonectria robusta]
MATFATASSRLEPSGRRTSSIAGGPIRVPGRVDDFASFMMLFHDIFLLDEFYTDFGMTDDVQTSNVIGSGAQFDVKLLQLRGQMALRTSGEASSRLTEGRVVVLKRPRRLFRQDGSFISDGPIRNIVNEFRVISHPRLRHHPNILDVYGFAWERTDNVPGVAVWPIIMEEYGSFGTLDEFLSQATPRDLTTKLQLMGDIAAGIQALHRCGISHSDLKPDNILVCETAEGHPVAKLADFGLSIITSERVAADEWDSGTPNWTVPEWGRVCPNESIMSADVYSCGLLLWTALLDGRQPWELDVFGSEIVFQQAKADADGFLNIALDSVRGLVPEERATEVMDLISSLLCSEEERDLSVLLHYASQSGDGFEEDQGTYLQGYDQEDRPAFTSFADLQTLPLPVQTQMMDSLKSIATNPGVLDRARKADACYSVAMFHVLRIGTVRPVELDSDEYTGYEIDWNNALKWLEMASEEGSPSAQAAYHSFAQAAQHHVPAEHVDGVPSVLPLTPMSWLEEATRLGSHLAAEHLRNLDHSAYIQANWQFRTQYCGIGRKLYEDVLQLHPDLLTSAVLDAVVSGPLNDEGDTALHVAATMGHLETIRRLCSGVDLNVVNSRGETALLQACRSGHADIAQYLLTLGANSGLVTSNGENVLHWLGAFDMPEEGGLFNLAHMMVMNGASLEQESDENEIFNQHFRSSVGPGTPLCRAVQRNAPAAAEVLLTLGANPYLLTRKKTSAMAFACAAHQTAFIRMFLEADYTPYVPSWREDPLPFANNLESAFEMLKVAITKPPTIQSAAPHSWKLSQEKLTEESFLGNVVAPLPLHTRINIHGAAYVSAMQESIDIIAGLYTESFARVTYDLHSALFHSILSRDLSITQHLLSSYPDETVPCLTNPLPNGTANHLPVQLALALGQKPVFSLLLDLAGPNASVSIPTIEGLNDSPEAQRVGKWFGKESILAKAKVSTQFRNIISLAAAAHPDPYFVKSILDQLPPDTAKELVNAHGAHDDIPLSAAIMRHFYAVAAVLLRHGAAIDEPAHASGIIGRAGIAVTTLGGLVASNNYSSSAAARWLLDNAPTAPSPVVSTAGNSIFDLAVAVGSVYEVEPGSPFPVRLYEFDSGVLRMLLTHYGEDGTAKTLLNPSESRLTALHVAVMKLRVEAIDALLTAGADPDIPIGSVRRSVVRRVREYLQRKLLSAWLGVPLELYAKLMNGGMTARQLALSLDQSIIPDQVRQRGTSEVARYMRRIEAVRSKFLALPEKE